MRRLPTATRESEDVRIHGIAFKPLVNHLLYFRQQKNRDFRHSLPDIARFLPLHRWRISGKTTYPVPTWRLFTPCMFWKNLCDSHDTGCKQDASANAVRHPCRSARGTSPPCLSSRMVPDTNESYRNRESGNSLRMRAPSFFRNRVYRLGACPILRRFLRRRCLQSGKRIVQ